MTINPRSRNLAAALFACALMLAALALPHAPARAKGRQHGDRWRVLAPVTYRNLTIFPVAGPDLAGSEGYVTLDEGTRAGTVVITERGARRMARRGPRRVRQQAASYDGGGASVNELALVNRSGKKLLLLAGEVVVGGQQDRIVQEDRIVPPVSVPVSLNVFCVEHGRWTPRTAGYGGPVARAEVSPEVAPMKFDSLGAVAHPKLRGAAQDRKAQDEVWNEVSENNARLGTATGTDTYQEVYKSGRVGAQMEDYVRALEREVLRPGVVGVVVARDGKPVWADVFASQRLFASYWPKLLKSYAVESLGEAKGGKPPTVEEAAAYLGEREGTVTPTTQAGVYQLVKTEQADYAVFELRDISLASPLRLHFNKMDR
ncbi:MAG TPA: DUF6569 family protein [Pyrinomonadaceae bacterium]